MRDHWRDYVNKLPDNPFDGRPVGKGFTVPVEPKQQKRQPQAQKQAA